MTALVRLLWEIWAGFVGLVAFAWTIGFLWAIAWLSGLAFERGLWLSLAGFFGLVLASSNAVQAFRALRPAGGPD